MCLSCDFQCVGQLESMGCSQGYSAPGQVPQGWEGEPHSQTTTRWWSSNETKHVYVHPTVTSTTVNCGNITLKLKRKKKPCLIALGNRHLLFALLNSLFLLFRNIMVLVCMVYISTSLQYFHSTYNGRHVVSHFGWRSNSYCLLNTYISHWSIYCTRASLATHAVIPSMYMIANKYKTIV